MKTKRKKIFCTFSIDKKSKMIWELLEENARLKKINEKLKKERRKTKMTLETLKKKNRKELVKRIERLELAIENNSAKCECCEETLLEEFLTYCGNERICYECLENGYGK